MAANRLLQLCDGGRWSTVEFWINRGLGYIWEMAILVIFKMNQMRFREKVLPSKLSRFKLQQIARWLPSLKCNLRSWCKLLHWQSRFQDKDETFDIVFDCCILPCEKYTGLKWPLVAGQLAHAYEIYCVLKGTLVIEELSHTFMLKKHWQVWFWFSKCWYI